MKRRIKISTKIIITILFLVAIFVALNTSKAAGIEGTTIVLNAGHGGQDTGCINHTTNVKERDLTLKISRYLEAELNKYYNVKVLQTHDEMHFPKDDYSDLAARAMVARNNKADLYVSLHINDFGDRSKKGASVYITSRKELPKYNAGMKILANKILDHLCSLGISREGVYDNRLCDGSKPMYCYYDKSKADYYGDIRYAMRGDSYSGYGVDFRDGSGIPTVLVEHCYMNSSDYQFLDSDADLQKLALADAKGIVEYFDLKLKTEVATGITVDKEKLNLIEGEESKITASIEPASVPNKVLNWTSSNNDIVTVDGEGNIKAIASGLAKITITSPKYTNISKTIDVDIQKYSLSFEKETEYMLLNRTKTLKLNATPTWIENKAVEWVSSDTETATVSQAGEVTPIKAGNVTITATWKEQNLSANVSVNIIELSPETKIEIPKYKLENKHISKIGEKVSKDEFLSNLVLSDNLKAELQILAEGQVNIGTNTKVLIKEKEHDLVVEEYECLVYGDIDGDGRISSMDYTLIKNHIMEVKEIKDENMKLTSDIDGDGRISSMDYTLIKNHIMEVKAISLK